VPPADGSSRADGAAQGDAKKPDVVPVSAHSPRTDTTERLGEALFFTTLMAPWNRSDGPLSRFTCETCHYEGYVDGRTHHTGRGDVHAVTKPLLGLWNNRPHFSRALDDDLTTVAFNEFRVAGAKSDHDPWFTLRTLDAPWVSRLGYTADSLSPELLRKALMTFLMAFNHRPNPMVIGRSGFSDGERAGAGVFRERCESCHEARLASDLPASRVPFDRWEALVMAREGAIVWGKAQYEKTGIEPYVHDLGARVPSLRRLYKKKPYFTNGSAPDLQAVLAEARVVPEGFRHAPPTPDRGATLDASSQAALLAFLDLL
jgi:cytochrome c peroxidase